VIIVEYLFPALIVAIGSAIQGSFGFGLGLVAAPILVLVDPAYAPAPMLTNGLVLTAMIAYRERRAIDRRGVAIAIIGRIPGVLLGAALLTVVSAQALGIGFGVMILAGVGMSAVGPRFEASPPILAGAGLVSGFMGTTTGVGGPPVALVYQHADPTRFRGTMAAYFLVGISISLVALAVVGRYGAHELHLALRVMPGALVGFGMSGRLIGWMKPQVVRPAVLVLSAAAATAVILRHLL
jgi:uncharacterized protein